jgi:hypothetical protein
VKTLRAVLLAAVLAVGAGACGADPEAEIGEAFKGYYTALLTRDFPAACAYNTPEATQKLLASVATQGITAGSCEQALAAVFAEPGAADNADALARSAKIDDVAVDGDEAVVRWTATVEGEPLPGTWNMRRIDGAWKLVLTD